VKWTPAWDPVSWFVSWQSVLHGRLWQENLDAVSWRISLCRSRCQETASGDCNRLRSLVCVCQWSVKCSSEWCIQVVNKSISNPHPVYSHTPHKYVKITCKLRNKCRDCMESVVDAVDPALWRRFQPLGPALRISNSHAESEDMKKKNPNHCFKSHKNNY
jgi:hypothetical protein